MQPRSSITRYSTNSVQNVGRTSALKASINDNFDKNAGDYLESLNKYTAPDVAQNMVNDINKIQNDAALISRTSAAPKMSSTDPGLNDMNAAKSMAIQNQTTEETEEATTDEEVGLTKKTGGKMKNPFGPYSYIVLAVLFLIRLSDQ